MRRLLCLLLCWVFLGAAGAATAQDEKRAFCDDANSPVPCTDDSLEVVFPVGPVLDMSEYRYDEFVLRTEIDTAVVLDVVSDSVVGWTFGVRSDGSVLRLLEDTVTTDGTVLDGVAVQVLDVVAGGYVSANVADLGVQINLSPGRHVVARASYLLVADAGLDGSRIELTEGLGSVDDAVEIAVATPEIKKPRELVDGVVRRVVLPEEICDNGVDDDGDTLVDLDDPDCDDPDCVDCVCPPIDDLCRDYAFYFGSEALVGVIDVANDTSFAISSRNAEDLLAFQFGVQTAQLERGTIYAFSGEVGTDDDRRISVLMTTDNGASVRPKTPNRMIARSDTIGSVRRGAALSALEDGDYLEYDTAPGVGGPGFFVGYVSDLDDNENTVASTGPGSIGNCEVNELLVVSFEAAACPDYAFYFGSDAGDETVDVPGAETFTIESRNAEELLAFQFGVRTTTQGQTTTYEFSSDVGTDPDRRVELLMTTATGASITPATPNRLVTDTDEIEELSRGAAIAGFDPGDYFKFDTEPGVGGPGFYVGYVADLDGAVNLVPATPPGDGAECPLNELVVVKLRRGVPVCPDYGYLFASEQGTTEPVVDAVGAGQFKIAGRNARPLLAFQLGVAMRPEPGDGSVQRLSFSSSLGTDDDRLIDLLMTTDNGASESPRAVNELKTDQPVTAIERGSALVGFDPGDYLEFDLAPGVGAPGFFVGYVSDLDDNQNRIPVTPPEASDMCPVNELLVVQLGGPPPDCPDFAFFFGGEATAEDADARGQDSFVISSRNVRPLMAFQLGVRTATAGAETTYMFSSGLGTDSDRLIELLMTDNQGAGVSAEAGNELIADTPQVSNVTRGSALGSFAPGDYLHFDTEPGVGGPGFFVGYVADMDGNQNQIPATPRPDGGACVVNELLVVEIGGDRPFTRGDVNADREVNITDAVIVLQWLIGNRIDTPVDCEDAFDADDNEELDLQDALEILVWMFQKGPALPYPFFQGLNLVCDVDPTNTPPPGRDPLTCRQSNCAGP